jgi:CheY-like chemotaxis protein
LIKRADVLPTAKKPTAVPTDAASQVEKGARRRSFGSLIVLLVDDMQEIREMYSSYLRFCGIGVATAGDGAEALDVAALCRPDVIVLDLSMPGMGGWETLEQIRTDARLKELPVILISAYGKPETWHQAMDAGADSYLDKPCLPSHLLEEIRRVTTGRRTDH